MEIIYSEEAQRDIEYWKKSGNKTIQKKIQQLLNVIKESPFEGIGKPEALRYNLSGDGLGESIRNTGLYMRFSKIGKP
jgi:toxin YoeB